jgi:transcriptional antiterminator NusG
MTCSHAVTVTPPELFETPRWYACRTRARAEKQADRLLAGHGVESYLPLIEQERQWSDRKKRVALPLFPGYVFARFNLRMMHGILSMPSIVTILRTNGYPTPLRDEELRSVRILVTGVNAGHGLPPRPVETLEVGQEVIVAEGAFAGMRGLLLEGQGRVRVVVRLSVLQAVSVQLPRRLLRSVPQDSDVPPDVVPLPMLGFEASAVQEVGAF